MYPLCESKAVVADLSKMSTINEYRQLVDGEISKLDVGYLALNAGIVQVGLTEQVTDREFESVFNVNGLHVVYMAKVMVDQM